MNAWVIWLSLLKIERWWNQSARKLLFLFAPTIQILLTTAPASSAQCSITQSWWNNGILVFVVVYVVEKCSSIRLLMVSGRGTLKQWPIASFPCDTVWGTDWRNWEHLEPGTILPIKSACFPSRDLVVSDNLLTSVWINYLSFCFLSFGSWQTDRRASHLLGIFVFFFLI